jgi:hypothetical protein
VEDWKDNFASEGARQYLAVLTARLVATISEVIGDDERLAPGEDGESLLMPSVDVLAMLCERYDAEPPRPATVRQWRAKYLAAYDAGAHEMGPPPEFRAGRRKRIDETFRWLEGVAESYHVR